MRAVKQKPLLTAYAKQGKKLLVQLKFLSKVGEKMNFIYKLLIGVCIGLILGYKDLMKILKK